MTIATPSFRDIVVCAGCRRSRAPLTFFVPANCSFVFVSQVKVSFLAQATDFCESFRLIYPLASIMSDKKYIVGRAITQ
ncbi:hypothetical protein [Novosphingobium sp. 9]|uniref:hypothetical protein n=1 Tax=Novosphingobium sp. 9 TaxID=2025349 RepID=UPI0021B5EE1C|nr:hypothetical protein [Novosphingobium sp. 9]